jgi:hypothetical protein
MYGQILRCMPLDEDPSDRFAVVVPEEAIAAVRGGPERVRRLLRVEVYAVSESGGVRGTSERSLLTYLTAAR